MRVYGRQIAQPSHGSAQERPAGRRNGSSKLLNRTATGAAPIVALAASYQGGARCSEKAGDKVLLPPPVPPTSLLHTASMPAVLFASVLASAAAEASRPAAASSLAAGSVPRPASRHVRRLKARSRRYAGCSRDTATGAVGSVCRVRSVDGPHPCTQIVHRHRDVVVKKCMKRSRIGQGMGGQNTVGYGMTVAHDTQNAIHMIYHSHRRRAELKSIRLCLPYQPSWLLNHHDVPHQNRRAVAAFEVDRSPSRAP